MDIVVLDANILIKSPRLRSREFLSLIEHRNEWDVRLVVPEVALMEAIAGVRREWSARHSAVKGMKLNDFDLGEEQKAMLARIDEHSEDYERWLPAHLERIGVTIASTPPVDPMELARRAHVRRAPYQKSEKKDGLRDTLIWLTVMAVAERHPDATVWFVSDNHQDFGPKPPHWTGENTGSRDDCPIRFHQELVEEMAACGLDGRIEYVVSVDRLEQYLAAQFAPINDKALATLSTGISHEAFAYAVAENARGFVLNPERAALQPGSYAAGIARVNELDRRINFYEGARRGRGVWTARFLTDADVDVMCFHPTHTGSLFEPKRLRLFGDVSVLADGTVQELTVTSAEALPGDEQLVLWRHGVSTHDHEGYLGLPRESFYEAVRQALQPYLTPDRISEAFRRAAADAPPGGLAEVAQQIIQEQIPVDQITRDILQIIHAQRPPEQLEDEAVRFAQPPSAAT